MEKRRNTFERLQRWGFGQRSASNNDLATTPPAVDGKKKDKSERLKDLTELLKGTRIPSLSGFHRNTHRESSCSPPPVPPPRRQRCAYSVDKSFEKLELIEDNESVHEGPPSPVIVKAAAAAASCGEKERKISVPSMKINEHATSPSSPEQARAAKPLHLSISSPHFRLLLDRSQPPHTTDCSEIPVHAEELFSLPKVEPKTIVGSYAQKNIPYRSASFSQVDFNSGKYSLGGGGDSRHAKEMNRNSASVLDSSTYPKRTRGDLRLLRGMKLGSPTPGQDHIAEESSPSPEHEHRRMSVLETIESYDIDESIGEEVVPKIEEAIPPTIDEVPTLLKSDDGAKKVDEEDNEKDSSASCSSGSDQKIYQTACEIPTPVFECCGKEVEAATEWFQLKEDGVDGSENIVKEEEAAAVQVDACGGLATPETGIESPDGALTPPHSQAALVDSSPALSASPDPCRVEVRKRNTFSSDSGNSKQSSLEKNDEGPSEERRKIDKSKRRKGIYIQWPVSEKGPHSSWDIDSPECEIVQPGGGTGGPLKLNVNLGLHFDCLSTASCDPLTPDSDNFMHNPVQWSRDKSPQPSGRKKSLTYQSSDEKDDLVAKKRTPSLLRRDSTSDNESDRAPSRDPRSVSPSREDLKRYSKRPLRGPYGQMLEAEMKKATKVHYDEILDDLRSSSELRTSPRVGRSNVSHSLDESARNAASKSPKPRKTSAHLPIPFHERAASTPSHMDHQAMDDDVDLSAVQKKFPNSVEKLYYDAGPPKKAAEPERRLQKSLFHSEAMLAAASTPPPPTGPASGGKQCKRTASAFMDRSSRKPKDGGGRKHNSELVETPRGPVASNDLLAELLKGSSEKHQQQMKRGTTAPGTPMRTLPQAVLKCLVRAGNP